MKPLLILIFLFFTVFAKAQDSIPQVDNPKVGLVLSGGGAKGLAHIGTLKVIDSLGIKIDYVAGTSMGAIIGSLYASGYTGKQLDSIFNGVDFDLILTDNLPRKAKTFYERENSDKYAFTLPFDKFKLRLPRAISKGQNTYNLLSRLTLHVADIDDFSKLPIPFFCIATNVETGEAVVLDKGNLPLAVKASGAFPSLFQPVNIDNQMLIDGGVVNNFPVDELKAKGVDIIIGVDVQDDLATRKELKSATDILFQINNYRTINEMKTKSKKTDIYIKPNILDFNVVSFGDGKQIIKNGEIATNKKIEVLQKLSNLQTQKQSILVDIKPVDSLKISSIHFNGLEKYSSSYAIGKLKFKAGEKIGYNQLDQGLNNFVATNNFDDFNYTLKPNTTNSGYDLVGNVKETNKTTFLRFAAHYDDLYKSAILVNFTKKQFLYKNDVLSMDLILGDNVRYNFDYYIDKGFYWSIGVSSKLSQFNKDIFATSLLTDEEIASTGVNKIDAHISELTNQFYLQTLLRKDFSFTLGLEHKQLKMTSETVVTNSEERETVFENSHYFSALAKLKFDTYNKTFFPDEGVSFNADLHYYVLSSDYNETFEPFAIAKADLGYAYSISDNFSANLLTEAGFSVNKRSQKYLNFVLGGYANNHINNFKSFYGYDFLNITGNSYIKSTLTFDYEIFKKNHINIAANIANVENDLYYTGNWLSSPTYTGYAVGYGIESFLGPVEIKYTWSPEIERGYWFFNLGFWF